MNTFKLLSFILLFASCSNPSKMYRYSARKDTLNGFGHPDMSVFIRGDSMLISYPFFQSNGSVSKIELYSIDSISENLHIYRNSDSPSDSSYVQISGKWMEIYKAEEVVTYIIRLEDVIRKYRKPLKEIY